MPVNLHKLLNDLAALSYCEKPLTTTIEGKEKVIDFKELNKETAHPYIESAKKFLINLDKLNMAIVPKIETRTEQQQQDYDQRNIEVLCQIIANFIKQIKHPKDVAKLFPIRELALRIYNAGTQEK